MSHKPEYRKMKDHRFTIFLDPPKFTVDRTESEKVDRYYVGIGSTPPPPPPLCQLIWAKPLSVFNTKRANFDADMQNRLIDNITVLADWWGGGGVDFFHVLLSL